MLSDLAAIGIHLKSWHEGEHRAVCPQCSATRRKKKDQCLRVRVDKDRAIWQCWHCSYSGAVFANGSSRIDKKSQKPPDLGGVRRKIRYGLTPPNPQQNR